MTNRISIFNLKIGVQKSAEAQLANSCPLWKPAKGSYVATSWVGDTAHASHTIHDRYETYDSLTGRWLLEPSHITASINYPRLPDAGSVTRGEADLIAAFTAHELGHVLYTDSKSFLSCRNLPFPKLHHKLLNGLEDPRIEWATIQSGKAAGAAKLFSQLSTKFCQKALNDPSFNPNDFAQAPFVFAILGRQAIGIEVIGADKFRSRITPKKLEWFERGIKVLLDAPLDRSGTAVLLEIVKELVAELNVNKHEDGVDVNPEPRPPVDEPEKSETYDDDAQPEDEDDEFEIDEGDQPEDGERGITEPVNPDDQPDDGEAGDDPTDGENGQPSDEEPEDGDDQGTKGGSTSEPAEPTEPADEDGESGHGSGASSSDEFDADDLTDDVADPEPNINEDIKTIAEREAERTGDDYSISSHGDKLNISDSTGGASDASSSKAGERNYKQTLKRINARSAPAKKQIKELLSSPDRNGWDDGQNTGRFDRRSASKLLSGYENVFQRRWEQEGIETAVSVLIDFSGSISWARDSLRDLSVFLAETLESAGVDYEINGFGSGSIYVLKPVGKKLHQCRDAIGNLHRHIGGGTPTAKATLHAIRQLQQSGANKRVLFVITDGSPDSIADVKGITRVAARQGLDVIGIGIGYDVSDQYPVSVSINSIDQLTGKVAGELVKRLRSNKAGYREA